MSIKIMLNITSVDSICCMAVPFIQVNIAHWYCEVFILIIEHTYVTQILKWKKMLDCATAACSARK